MEILASGMLTAENARQVLLLANEIITPNLFENDVVVDHWYVLRDYDGARRLLLGDAGVLSRYAAYVVASTQ